jgi:hypothetical protein
VVKQTYTPPQSLLPELLALDIGASIKGRFATFFFGDEGPRSKCYGRTAALRLLVQPYDEHDGDHDDDILSLEHRWNEINRGKSKYSEKNLSQYHFVHHKSHMHLPGIEPRLSHGTPYLPL